MDIVERLRKLVTLDEVGSDNPLGREAADEIERLRQVCRDAYEVWAGSEGIPEPVNASEAYLLLLLEQMREEVRKGLNQ